MKISLCLIFFLGANATLAYTQETIQVSDYDSLQAALDVVPESGGVVQIPPGEFELREPLIVRTANTRIEGAGAASHLVNRNEEGQPALIVRPDGCLTDPKTRM